MIRRDVKGYVSQLEQEGYCIIPDLFAPDLLAQLEADLEADFAATPFGEGDFYGAKTKRFGRLLRRSAHARSLALEETVLGLAETVLGDACERIQLNVAQAIEIHPGEIEQFPHADQDMWAGIKGQHEYLLNVMWPLTPFTGENGATRLYPGTHRCPVENLQDLGEPLIAEAMPGAAICFLGSTLHGAGANRSGQVRRGVVIGYSLGWLKPYENLWLAYPPAVARDFPPELARLVGYVQHRPNLGNYEGQCPSVLLSDPNADHLAARDALRADQEAVVRAYATEQRPTR